MAELVLSRAELTAERHSLTHSLTHRSPAIRCRETAAYAWDDHENLTAA
jgi:hypothetical protein